MDTASNTGGAGAFATEPQEELCRRQITVGRQHEIYGFANRIDGTVKIGPPPGDSNVGFVDPSGSIPTAQFATNALIQNGRIPLHPSLDRDVVDRETALRHFFQIPVAERVSQVPPHGQHDDLSSKCRPRNNAGRF
jgi:hypothetical protein